jgi:hypothetical protein
MKQAENGQLRPRLTGTGRAEKGGGVGGWMVLRSMRWLEMRGCLGLMFSAGKTFMRAHRLVLVDSLG